jgi:hypothetical protein
MSTENRTETQNAGGLNEAAKSSLGAHANLEIHAEARIGSWRQSEVVV